MPGSLEPNRRLGVVPVVKFTMTMVMLGLLIAIISYGISYLVITQQPVNLKTLYAWDDIILWIWPASIMMMAMTGFNASSLFILVVFIIANGYVYGFLGFIVGSVRQKYLEDENRWPRSRIWGYIRRDAKRALVFGGLISAALNLISAPWYLADMRRSGAVVGPSLIVRNALLLWVELGLLIFLPLFLRSGFQEKATIRIS